MQFRQNHAYPYLLLITSNWWSEFESYLRDTICVPADHLAHHLLIQYFLFRNHLAAPPVGIIPLL